jgi:hypothetical protein
MPKAKAADAAIWAAWANVDATGIEDPAGLAKAAGSACRSGAQDVGDLVLIDGRLHVRDVTQAALDAALAALDPAQAAKDRLLAYAADRRWQIETGGLDIGGATIATDRDAQGMISGAYQMAMAEPEETVLFKAASGWIEIDAAQMIAIGLAVGRHVRACFRKEQAIGEDIAAGKITDAAGIDAAFAAG